MRRSSEESIVKPLHLYQIKGGVSQSFPRYRNVNRTAYAFEPSCQSSKCKDLCVEAMHTGLWHQINHLSTLASWSFLLSRGDVSPGISLGNFSWLARRCCSLRVTMMESLDRLLYMMGRTLRGITAGMYRDDDPVLEGVLSSSSKLTLCTP